MDADRFDFLTRGLAATRSRRGIGRALAGLMLGGALGSLRGLDDAEARKKTCRHCGPCKTCSKGKCKPKPDGVVCAFGKTCLDGTCACTPGTTEVAGRCAEPCDATCRATINCCRKTFDTQTQFRAHDPAGERCPNSPCSKHRDCATNELCAGTGCPAIDGVTNKCFPLGNP